MTLNKKYILDPNPPPPLLWDEYKYRLETEWNRLINSENSKNEGVLQKFLEKHPCLLPGPYGMNVTSGHGPFPSAVISQPVLKGLTTKFPDFMWLGMDSSTFYPVLIEIETPHKKWFTKKGVPTSELTQALDQLVSWRAWFNKPSNQTLFLDYYKIPTNWRINYALDPEYVLIYGRREELWDRPDLNTKRNEMSRKNEYLMTFDRLKPQYDAKNKFTVKIADNGYHAIAFPPTYVIYPGNIDNLMRIKNKDEAILNSEWLDDNRKQFLIKRFPYWELLAKQGNIGWINTSDFE